MQDEFENLSEMLNVQFLKNLKFLQDNHKKTFEKVNKLTYEIENNIYEERYALEFKQEGYFDILDLKTNKFLYGFNSYTEAEKRKEIVDFSSKHSLNLLRVDPKDNKLALMTTLGELNPLVNFMNSIIDFKNITFSKIFKFVFIGVGAGIHINEIYKKIDSMNTLIIEPNLEIFRLSMFLLDYSTFEKNNKKLFLSVADDAFQREYVISKFDRHHNYMNYNIKYHLFSLEQEYILQEMIDFFSHNFSLSFSYNATLQVVARTIKIISLKHKFLKKSLLFNNPILKNKKVLIVSAGPSIDERIDWIYENQDKFIIVCVDIILKKLEKNNIVPDIVVSIDPSHLVANFFDTQNKEFLKNSAIIFLTQQHDDVLEKVKDLNIYFSQVLPVSEEPEYYFSVPNVGTFSFAISLFLGANELYLVGSDAAFNQKTGSRYAKDNSRTVMDKLQPSKKNSKGISDEDILEVKGNLKNSVKTNRELYRFKKDYELFIFDYKKTNTREFTAYNLSNGAYIEGLIPLNPKDIDTKKIPKKSFNKSILEKVTITIDNLNLKKDSNLLLAIIQKVKKFQKIDYKTKDEFLQKKLDLMIWILEQKKEMSNATYGKLFLQFIELIDTYINYVLNIEQKKLQDMNTINYLKNYWCEALILLTKRMKAMTDIKD